MEINPVSGSLIPLLNPYPNPREEPVMKVTTFKTVSEHQTVQTVYYYNCLGQLVTSQKSTIDILA
jgi:hypothetical protein